MRDHAKLNTWGATHDPAYYNLLQEHILGKKHICTALAGTLIEGCTRQPEAQKETETKVVHI
jgi:hypothetical protein